MLLYIIFILFITANAYGNYDPYEPCEKIQYFYLTSQMNPKLCITTYGASTYVDYCSQYTSGQHWVHLNGTLRNLQGYCLYVSNTNLKAYNIPGFKCEYMSNIHLNQSSRWIYTCDDEFLMEGRNTNAACMHIANAQNGPGSTIVMNTCLGENAPSHQQWNKIFAGYVGYSSV